MIILLGANDLKMRFSVSAFDIANRVGALVQIVQKSETGRRGGAPQVLLLPAPPPVAKLTGCAEIFEGAETKSERLAEHYARVAPSVGLVQIANNLPPHQLLPAELVRPE